MPWVPCAWLVLSRTECTRCSMCVFVYCNSGCSVCLIFEGLRPAIEGVQPGLKAHFYSFLVWRLWLPGLPAYCACMLTWLRQLQVQRIKGAHGEGIDSQHAARPNTPLHRLCMYRTCYVCHHGTLD